MLQAFEPAHAHNICTELRGIHIKCATFHIGHRLSTNLSVLET